MSEYLQLQESERWVYYDAVIKSSLAPCRKHGRSEAQEHLLLISPNPHFIAYRKHLLILNRKHMKNEEQSLVISFISFF